jgi:hypothetical protein
VQFQNKIPCRSAMAEQLSDCSGPRAQGKKRPGLHQSLALTLTLAAHQSPEERLIWKFGVGTGHGIAPQQKAIRLRMAKEAMEEKSVFAKDQYDFAAAHFVDRAALDLDDIVRPDARQHALPLDLHAQTAKVAQNVRS